MRVAVVMPAWNEAEGIAGFLEELSEALSEWTVEFIVVDDCSSDRTAEAVGAAAKRGTPVSVLSNEVNRGHGPSTMRALRAGLATGADVVVAIDGDGQFLGSDVARVVERIASGNSLVVEGVRSDRGDAVYRRLTSEVTRALVWSRAHTLPADANTPLRAYRPDLLQRLLDRVPPDAMTPNLIISALCRKWRVPLAEVPVASRPRRGLSAQGTTWGARRASLPSRRFVTFCLRATGEWVRL
jgi:glycosyltransferase involved in cell wall biosynthesis